MMQTREQLQDRIAELEALLGIDATALSKFKRTGLSPIRRRLLGLLVARDVVTRDMAYTSLWGHLPDHAQPNSDRAVDCHVSYVRQALRHIGVQLDTVNVSDDQRVSWRLSPAMKQRLDEWEASFA